MNFKELRKKNHLLFTFLLTLCMLMLSGIHPTKAFAFSGSGSGTQSNPYIITLPGQLSEARSNPSASYKLGNDIDLNKAQVLPIGDSTAAFTGTFDGGNFTIKNLVINNPSLTSAGLFGNTSGATIKNLNILELI